ncbi:MAG: BREX-1 system adenine-specific DNA-methyltransferase PglX [Crocinitomix sp.]|nr:BREX-1 system adenine-specific DNA-methyltransferase PglX [Crocinitomix sp.]
MKLNDHVEHIRLLVYKSFNNQFSRLGIGPTKELDIEKIPDELHGKRKKIDFLIHSHKSETGSYTEARAKALDELTFTLFNRLAAIKVMEAHQLFPPIITKQAEHGDRSFGHKVWLEGNPEMREEELEGIRSYFKHEFNVLGESIPLFHKNYPYALLPYVIELNEIIDAFNEVELDSQIENDIWQSDDILGWLYESYNNSKKQAHKDSKAKTEYNKVSIQSQVYTPRWVVEFLVQNSLGKLYLEMYPDSDIKNNFKIANAPKDRIRDIKPLHEIKLIDPASGSGNFLLYAFEFFYHLYQDQIDNYSADYEEEDIPQLIIENNLHGIDLDDRAIQLAQLGLWVKAKKLNRNIAKLNFNVVSSDFMLPDFMLVEPVFKQSKLDAVQLNVIEEVWGDLQQAYKFGSLVRIEEKINLLLSKRVDSSKNELFQDGTLFEDEFATDLVKFKKEFIANCEEAFSRFARQQGNSFLTDKTKDALTFLKLITQQYDIATANPPYTDSSDFGPSLKKFIETNYKKPYKFNTNLYSTFIKRCFELTNDQGKIGMIHPHTFMFLPTFEDVRKFILEKSHIDVMVDFGLDRVNLFGPGILLDATFYVLSKAPSKDNGIYINLTVNLKERFKKSKFLQAIEDHCNQVDNMRVYSLQQSKLKIIKAYPFIYWISDEFRIKFGGDELGHILKARKGLGTQSERFFRFWWEVDKQHISKDYVKDKLKWVRYVKGGPFKKWFGNIWLILNWQEDGKEIKVNSKTNLRNPDTYFIDGIACSLLSSKGSSFRFQPKNIIYDSTTRSIFFEEDNKLDRFYILGFLNSNLCSYILDSLNSTVAVNSNDIHRVPLVKPGSNLSTHVQKLVCRNITLKKKIFQFCIFEFEFQSSPLFASTSSNLSAKISDFFNFENHIITQILLNEAIINTKIFEVYELTEADKTMVLAKKGQSIGELPVNKNAKEAYLANEISEFPLDNIRAYIESLPEKEFNATEREAIENEFPQLYQSNNDLEAFCIRHQVNPINVWYWFKESNVIPKQRMNDLAMEFLADLLREILMEDEDGIIPLVPNAGEKILLERIEEKFIEKGFSMAQYASFDSVLGRELNEYINHHFFKAFSDHLNLFMYLPKTPFIWHLTSGPEQGFDCYIIIYKWSRDRLLSIRSVYIEQRERSLENRQSDLRGKESLNATEQNEADKIYKQLLEIESFKKKIDELLAEGYNPILDDGVGKNIAPLQSK